MAELVDATKVEQDGPILLGANKLLQTGSNPVLTTKQFKTKKQMTDYYIDNKEYYLWCVADDVIPYH